MDLQSKNSSTESGKSGVSREKEVVHRYNIQHYTKYQDFFEDVDESKPLYIFYIGTESPTSGYSWCPLCTEASQALEKYLAELSESILLIVHVGSEDEWEDTRNPFRNDEELQLKVVPTISKYKTPKRLEGQYCLRPELLQLLFREEYEF